MLSLIKIQKLCNLRENHLSLMEMISDKNNNLDKLYYNDFSLQKTTSLHIFYLYAMRSRFLTYLLFNLHTEK